MLDTLNTSSAASGEVLEGGATDWNMVSNIGIFNTCMKKFTINKMHMYIHPILDRKFIENGASDDRVTILYAYVTPISATNAIPK